MFKKTALFLRLGFPYLCHYGDLGHHGHQSLKQGATLYDSKLYDLKLYHLKLYDLKLCDLKLNDLKQGAALYDLLGREVELREKRQTVLARTLEIQEVVNDCDGHW